MYITHLYLYTYIYIYTHTYIYIYIYIRVYIYIYVMFVMDVLPLPVVGPLPAPQVGLEDLASTVSFRNFKSQNFKLSVSNPKSKYVAYVSILSQISNCQGLGRKNKHEMSKTDRNNDNNDRIYSDMHNILVKRVMISKTNDDCI